MSSVPSTFSRGLNPGFLDTLDKLADDAAQGGWWRDVLVRSDLILAVRREALNVYYRGASLYRISFVQGRVVPETHIKYLVRQSQAYVPLNSALHFEVATADIVQDTYKGPKTLAAMIAATRGYESAEKAGLHPLILASPNVVDVELSLERAVDDGIDGEDLSDSDAIVDPPPRRQDRIDAVSLEAGNDDATATLAFHEAKTFLNPEIRSWDGGTPKIVGQIERYRKTLTKHAPQLKASYVEVCKALVRLDAMRQRVRAELKVKAKGLAQTLDPLVGRVAAGEVSLEIDPQVRLLIYGFDADQRDGSLARILAKLKPALPIYAVGNTKSVKNTPAFRKRTKTDPIASVPMPDVSQTDEVAVPKEEPLLIPLPAGAPQALSLYFAPVKGETVPVYLCNPGTATLTEVKVTAGSPSEPELSPVVTKVPADGTLPPGQGLLIDRYGLMWDGDVLMVYAVTYADETGTQHSRRAFIDKGGPKSLWVTLK